MNNALSSLHEWNWLVSVCVVGGGGVVATPHPTLAGSITIYAKTTVHCSPDSSILCRLGSCCVQFFIKGTGIVVYI